MQRNSIGKSIWSGAVAAAAFFMAPEAHAVGWCPTPTDNTISCSNCSRELTCDVYYFGIIILGNNVTLDGKNRQIFYSPGVGINVHGHTTMIKNVFIDHAATTGIRFQSTTVASPSYVDNVRIYSSGSRGIYTTANHPVTINNLTSSYNSTDGVATDRKIYTDLRNSLLIQENLNGYWASLSGWNSIIYNNSFAWNGNRGVTLTFVSGVTIQSNTFTNNFSVGLDLSNVSGTLKNNNGSLNSEVDCLDHGGSLNLVRSGNTWGTYSGSGCVP